MFELAVAALADAKEAEKNERMTYCGSFFRNQDPFYFIENVLKGSSVVNATAASEEVFQHFGWLPIVGRQAMMRFRKVDRGKERSEV
jgi:hypothetical protein